MPSKIIRRLKEISTLRAGGTPDTSVPAFWGGSINWLNSGAVKNNTITIENVEKKITNEGLDSSAAKIIPANSVLVAITGATCGNIAFLPFESSTNQSVISITFKENFYPKYFFYYLLKMRNKILRLQGGSAQGGVTLNDLKEFETKFPTYQEQVKTGSFLSAIDRLIEKQKEKVDRIKSLKRGYLQDIFPIENKLTPNSRFSSFNGEWKRIKLSDFSKKLKDGDWIESKDQSESGIRLIQTGNIDICEFVNKPNNTRWISEETYNRLNCEQVFPGDILISRLPDPAGRACIIPETGFKMITSVDCTIVRLLPKNDPNFLVQYLSTQSYFEQVNKLLGGGTRQRIGRTNLEAISTPVPPSYEEQSKIGSFFAAIDRLIGKEIATVEQFESLKKGYLQKIFAD